MNDLNLTLCQSMSGLYCYSMSDYNKKMEYKRKLTKEQLNARRLKSQKEAMERVLDHYQSNRSALARLLYHNQMNNYKRMKGQQKIKELKRLLRDTAKTLRDNV